MEVTETVAMEKKVIHINRVAEPTRSPSPTSPSQAAAKTPDVNPPAEPESKTDLRVKERAPRHYGPQSPRHGSHRNRSDGKKSYSYKSSGRTNSVPSPNRPIPGRRKSSRCKYPRRTRIQNRFA